MYDDESRLSAITYGGVTDAYTYNWQGLRRRAYLAGPAGGGQAYYRYVYNGQRVLEETNDSNGTLARYTLANSGYFAPLLHFKRNDGSMRYPIYEGVGTARRLVDGAGTATDAYSLDAFGRYMGGWANPTPNPYRFGGAWGYLTDTPGSGLLQLGARYYWPELGRFIEHDPIGDGVNWYTHAGNNPARYVDADGESPLLAAALVAAAGGGVYGGVTSALSGGDWKQGAAKGAIVAGVTVATAGLAGPAIAAAAAGGVVGGPLVGGISSVAGDLAGQGYGMLTGQQPCFSWAEAGFAGTLGGLSGGILLRPSTAGMQPVTSWAPDGVEPDLAPGRWVMTGGKGAGNYARSRVWEPKYAYPYGNSVTDTIPGSQLSYPPGWEWWKGLIGQRVVH